MPNNKHIKRTLMKSFLGKPNLLKLTSAKIFFENMFNHVILPEERAKMKGFLGP